MGPLKLAGGLLLALVLTLPLAANTLPVQQFTPDRDGRSHRYTDLDSQQFVNDNHNVIQNSGGGDLFRPGRNGSLNNVDDNVNLPPNEDDERTANNPAAPDVPADQVPEPSTLLLVAPAALGFLRKFRR